MVRSANELRSGMAVRLDSELYRVLEAKVHAGGGQMKGTLHARLECLRTGGVTERRFRPEERLDEIELTRQEMEYLYDEGDRCVFMHPTSFDQVLLPKAALGNRPARPPPSRRG